MPTAELLLQRLAPIGPKLGTLPAGVQIWQLDLRQDPQVLLGARGLLSDEERATGDRFVRPASRRCHVLSKAIVRAVLGQRLGLPPREVQFELGQWGKPALRDSPVAPALPLHFNVSHSGEHLLLVVAEDRAVGVDLERIRPRRTLQALATYAFSPRELAAFQQVGAAEQLTWFYRQCAG